MERTSSRKMADEAPSTAATYRRRYRTCGPFETAQGCAKAVKLAPIIATRSVRAAPHCTLHPLHSPMAASLVAQNTGAPPRARRTAILALSYDPGRLHNAPSCRPKCTPYQSMIETTAPPCQAPLNAKHPARPSIDEPLRNKPAADMPIIPLLIFPSPATRQHSMPRARR